MPGPESTGPAAPSSSVPDLQILSDPVTLHPSADPPSLPSSGAPERNLVDHMTRFRDSPLEFLRDISLHVAGTGWRAFDNPIGQPMFYRGFTDNMKADVLGSPMLASQIAALADRRVGIETGMKLLGQDDEGRRAKRRAELVKNLDEVAAEMLDNMVCKMESKAFIRSAFYLVSNLVTTAYHQGIHVSSEEVLRLRRVAEDCAQTNRSIVFLPCHRSHVDVS